MSRNNIITDLKSEPAYYHRDYEQDLPKAGEDDSYAKRITLTALPFIALYRPAGWILSLSMDSLRGIVSFSETATALHQADAITMMRSVLKTGLAVAALAATILMHPVGLLVTTGSDLFTYSFQSGTALYHGDYSSFLEHAGNLANSGVYFAMLTTNSLALIILSLSIQLGVEGYKTLKELKNEHYIELTGHLLMACLRASQVNSHLQAIPYQQNLQRTAESSNSTVKETNGPAETFVKQVEASIVKGDLKTFTELQNSASWKTLSQKDLGNLTDKLMVKRFSQSDQDLVGLAMLDAIVFQHPNSDQSISRLKHLIYRSCQFENISLFKFLMNKSSIIENLTDKHMLKFLSILSYSNTGGKGNVEILKLLMQHPKWKQNSPELLESALIVLINGGFLPQTARMEAIEECLTYPSWNQLTQGALTRIASTKSIRFIGGCEEMSSFAFTLLNKHPSWGAIECQNLSKIAEHIASCYVNPDCTKASLARLDIMKMLAAHANWGSLGTTDLMKIAMPIAAEAGYGGKELLSVISAHPNWDKMPPNEFYVLTWHFFHAGAHAFADAELIRMLSQHKAWLQLNKEKLAEFAGMVVNKDRLDLLRILAEHANWSQLNKADILEMLKWCYWSNKISGILEVLSKLPAWQNITKNDLQACGVF